MNLLLAGVVGVFLSVPTLIALGFVVFTLIGAAKGWVFAAGLYRGMMRESWDNIRKAGGKDDNSDG